MAPNCEECIHKGPKSDSGMIWCNKKQIYIDPKDISECPDFEKQK